MTKTEAVKEIVRKADCLSINDLTWKPIYPNNMKTNGLDGYYCLLLHKNENGTYGARKYSIKFQHKELEAGTGHVDPNIIEMYVLFEKCYPKIVGKLSYPDASECGTPKDLWCNNDNALNSADINDCGEFVRAYTNIEDAKMRALTQYKSIYAYAMSHLIDDAE